MLKHGRYRAWRNLPIGWLTHSVHGRDKSEQVFHLANEFFLILVVVSIFRVISEIDWLVVVVSVFVCHTVMWIVDGNFHVYVLDSFRFVKNPGIDEVIRFVNWVVLKLGKNEAVGCILIYGSFCRGMFHQRSDLDLRIVRKESSFIDTIFLFYMAVYVRFVSLLKGVPTDLQVVDSFDFLHRQMRSEEKPVVVFSAPGINVHNKGFLFSEIVKNPSMVLKCSRQ